MSELKEVITNLNTAFTEFKGTNDSRLNDLTDRLEKFETRANRPGLAAPSTNPDLKGFNQFLKTGDKSGLEQKALSTGVDADGGYAVPQVIDQEMDRVLSDLSPIRSLAKVVKATTQDYHKLISLGGAASGWVAETAARPETNTPTLADIAPPIGELYANPATTQILLDDAQFDAGEWLIDEVADVFATQEGTAFITGNGTDKPKGILAYTLSTSDDSTRTWGELQKLHTGTAGDFDADDLISLMHTLRARYRQGATWVMNDATLAKVRKFKDSNGMYLWQPSAQAGQPELLLGYPVRTAEDMPDVAADSNAVMFGNYQRGYLIVDRTETRVLRDPLTNKPYVHFYTTKRVGGAVVDSNAIKVLTLSI